MTIARRILREVLCALALGPLFLLLTLTAAAWGVVILVGLAMAALADLAKKKEART